MANLVITSPTFHVSVRACLTAPHANAQFPEYALCPPCTGGNFLVSLVMLVLVRGILAIFFAVGLATGVDVAGIVRRPLQSYRACSGHCSIGI